MDDLIISILKKYAIENGKLETKQEGREVDIYSARKTGRKEKNLQFSIDPVRSGLRGRTKGLLITRIHYGHKNGLEHEYKEQQCRWNSSHQAWVSFNILESNKDLSLDCVQSHL